MNFSTLTALLLLLCSGFSARGSGFSFPLPPGYVNPQSGHRNNVFYVGQKITFTLSPTAASYQVRDYYGNMVDQGAITGTAPQTIVVNAFNPGWYKLYLYGTIDQGAPWGAVVGGTTFVIFRNDPNFPAFPPPSAFSGWYPSEDESARDAIGMGPQRLFVPDPTQTAQAIANLEQDLAVDEALYMPFDPVRKRALLIAFPNGTIDSNGNLLAGVTQIIQHFQDRVQYWEGRNEPNSVTSGFAYATGEMSTFYQAVKSVNPALKVVGPALVTAGPSMSPWVYGFLLYGGGQCIDVFSFHAYNNVNGDPWLVKQSLNGLTALLALFNLQNIQIWQTEQSYFAANYGAYQPRLEGRWTMVQMMMFEQYGIPKEHNVLWYDLSHGFWTFPAWWENEDGGLNPAAPLMRVWSEELYGTTFQSAYNFGPVANDMYIGDLFSGPGKSVAAFMSAGNPCGVIQLSLPGATAVTVDSPFGVGQVLPVTNGILALPVSELPSYVQLPAGQVCNVIAPVYGTNLAMQTGVTITASGSPVSPLGSSIPNSTAKIADGILQNWYYNQTDADQPWMSNVTQWPATVEFDFPQMQTVSDVLIFAGVPWQSMSTLLDYDLQYWDGSTWQTIEHVTEPTKTFPVFTPPVRCTVDSFFSDRWVFEHHFTPVATQKIRLLVNSVTYGGGATQDVVNAGGQTGPQQIVLREVEIYNSKAGVAPQVLSAPVGGGLTPAAGGQITAGASGSGPLSYQWAVNGVAIPGANTANLDVSTFTAQNDGLYTVSVTNAAGTTTSAPIPLYLATPFTTWAAKYFPPASIANPSLLASEDSDGDSISNLLEYFYDTDPIDGGSAAQKAALPVSTVEILNGQIYLDITYRQNANATDVVANIEASNSLTPGSWQAVQPDIIQQLGPDPATGDPWIRAKVAAKGSARFIRLSVTLP